MFGVVRTVEYNESSNQSLLHFECIHLDQTMKNEVLSFVYNMLPEREKEVYEALKLTDTDEVEAGDENLENTAAQQNADSIVTNDIQNTLNNATDMGRMEELKEEPKVNLPELPDDISEPIKQQISPDINISE